MPKQWKEKAIILMSQLNESYILLENIMNRKLGVKFYPTWLRLEKEESIEEKLDYLIMRKFPIVVFTHEWAIMDDEHKIWSNFERVFERVNCMERKIRYF